MESPPQVEPNGQGAGAPATRARADDASPARRWSRRLVLGFLPLVALAVAAFSLADDSQPPLMLAGPWLQQPTETSVIVMWETAEPTTGVVRYGRSEPFEHETTDGKTDTLHEVTLTGLAPGAPWHYVTVSRTAEARTFESQTATFVAAPTASAAACFAVVGDTQDQPDVWARVAERVRAERPAFLVHCGDIVGDGLDPREWRKEFFAPAKSLLAGVPFLAALGNHDADSPLYYRYVANPSPEHRCSFRYGALEFFVLDSERPLEEGTEQYRWLDAALEASRAGWKIVVVHRPPWSSALDDYGDARRTSPGEGDPRSRPVIPLLERRGVDLLFCGHVHDYERTWPIRDGRVDEERGVTYVQTGGAGGHAEVHAPARSWFTAHARAAHHFVLVNVLGGTLDLKAYDDEGRLFDHWIRRKPPAVPGGATQHEREGSD
jgi:predicted phosphodiesterase